MVSQPRSFRSLNELIRATPTTDELREILNHLGNERNDRAMAIGYAALVEYALVEAIQSQFVSMSETDEKDIFEGTAPLATFSAKIRIGYAIGIYGPGTKDELDCIRRIRNAFAHTKHLVTFKTPEIVTACARLKIPDEFIYPDHLKNGPATALFSCSSVTLLLNLSTFAQGITKDSTLPLVFDLSY